MTILGLHIRKKVHPDLDKDEGKPIDICLSRNNSNFIIEVTSIDMYSPLKYSSSVVRSITGSRCNVTNKVIWLINLRRQNELLTSDEQIEDAKYLLNLLRNKTDRNEVRALLTGFLASTRAILDHLLEEYNIKYGLNI